MANAKEEKQSGRKKGQATTSAGKGARSAKPLDTRSGTFIETRQASKTKDKGDANSGGRSRDGSR